MRVDVRFVRKACVLCLVLLAAFVGAEEPSFPQRIEWRSNANALEYKVEIQNTATKETSTITTEKTFAELSLSPGNYRYRVTAYDFLGRESDVSKWTAFTIIQAAQPEIRRVDKKVTLEKATDRVEINVDIANVSADSKVELIGENVTGELGSGVKKGSEDETGTVSKVYFKDVPPGKWRLRVTNASGFSAESDVIEVEGKWTAKQDAPAVVQQEPTEAEKAAAEAERLRKEEEERLAEEKRQQAEAEKRLEYERRQQEATAEAELKRKIAEAEAEERRLAAEKAREEKEAKKAARKKYREEHPYVPKDIHFQGGIGFAASPYDGTLSDYNDGAVSFMAQAKFSFFPVKREKNRFGLEFLWYTTDFSRENEYYNSALDFMGFYTHIVWQHRLFGEKSFFALKGGGGLCTIDKTIEYRKDGDGRTRPEEKRFFYPAASAGVSLFFIPFKFCVAEFGVDVTHIAAKGMPSGVVIPYACIGIRL